MYVVTVDEEVCVGCGECVTACPAQLFTLQDGKATVGNDDCLGCQSCAEICPVGAIKVEEF